MVHLVGNVNVSAPRTALMPVGHCGASPWLLLHHKETLGFDLLAFPGERALLA